VKPVKFTYERKPILPGYDGITCKIYPQMMYDGDKTAFLTYSMLLLTGSDVFYDSYVLKSTDAGATFSDPIKLTRQETVENGIRKAIGHSSVHYNRFHKKWIILGHESSYADDRSPILINGIGSGCAMLTFFAPEACDYMPSPTEIPMPFPCINATPHGQIIEFENGDMLVSFYFTTPTQTKAGVVTVRYALEGNRLRIVKAGEPIVGVDYARGYCEPSVAKLGDRYYLTIRTDEVGLFAESDDGYHFSTPKPWVWDDGEVLPNYNTMQRFIRHKDGLFLAYTRRGAHNDHVFRHRAPMFMTRFDEDRKCLIRSEEVILVPEMGTRLGNFSVTNISPTEEWLLTAEWMQPAGCEKYGSDNRIWLAKVKFSE